MFLHSVSASRVAAHPRRWLGYRGWLAVCSVLLAGDVAGATVLASRAGASVHAPRDPAPGDPLEDFERYYDRRADAPSRVEAVLILKGAEAPGVVDALAPLLDDEVPEVVAAVERVFGGFRSRPPVERLLALLPRAKPVVSTSLLRAIEAGRYGSLGDSLDDLLEHKRWELRYAALGAFAASGDPRAATVLETACEDPESAVRCRAFERLVELGPEAALERAPSLLEDERWQVRAAAIAGLSRLRDVRSVELLIAHLEREEGRLVADATSGLAALTGRGFGLSVEGWRSFWAAVKERYVLPSEDELAAIQARREAKDAVRYATEVVRYHGIETPSRSLLFVLDVSASMDQLVMGDLREEEQELRRIDVVKRELLATLDALPPYAQFNILTFSTEVQSWKRAGVKATKANKKSARRFLERLDVAHGASRSTTFRTTEDVAPAVASTVLQNDAGRTNTYGALSEALSIAGRGSFDRNYELSVDTILFLSDGMPSHGERIAPDDILRDVRRANRLRRVALHTIAIGDFNKDFMSELAQENGGRFVDLGN